MELFEVAGTRCTGPLVEHVIEDLLSEVVDLGRRPHPRGRPRDIGAIEPGRNEAWQIPQHKLA